MVSVTLFGEVVSVPVGVAILVGLLEGLLRGCHGILTNSRVLLTIHIIFNVQVREAVLGRLQNRSLGGSLISVLISNVSLLTDI